MQVLRLGPADAVKLARRRSFVIAVGRTRSSWCGRPGPVLGDRSPFSEDLPSPPRRPSRPWPRAPGHTPRVRPAWRRCPARWPGRSTARERRSRRPRPAASLPCGSRSLEFPRLQRQERVFHGRRVPHEHQSPSTSSISSARRRSDPICAVIPHPILISWSPAMGTTGVGRTCAEVRAEGVGDRSATSAQQIVIDGNAPCPCTVDLIAAIACF